VSDLVTRADDGPVRTLTLNDPDRRNPLGVELRRHLLDELTGAMADPAVRAVVLTGAGPVFSAGGDLSAMRRRPAAEALELLESAQAVVRTILAGPVPVVAAVEGAAFGAGVALAAACDMGIYWSLPRRVGATWARRMLMFGDEVDGSRAVDIGLADVLADAGEALAVAAVEAARVARGPRGALAAVKEMLGTVGDRDAVLDAEARTQSSLTDTDDFAEGFAAFKERRAPSFGGAN
jgi:2-(1,2-epoxy-1,2-dihydrophenyl)acetyl-CoA isomerase